MKRILLAAVGAAMLLAAPCAQGADLLFWENYNDRGISFAGLDGGGGGSLSLGDTESDVLEGIAIDSATGRLFVASSGGGPEGNGQIVAVNLDGSGAAVFNAPGAPVERPAGIAIDPVTRIVYWGNFGSGENEVGSIAWARLDGSGGGALNTTGATIGSPARVAIDPAGGRIYWLNSDPIPATISFANLNNTGGGDLNLAGATPPRDARAIAVDSAAGRVYFLGQDSERLSYAATAGTGGGDVGPPASSPVAEPYGLAIDPLSGRFYWGNFAAGFDRTRAIAFADLAGNGGAVEIATAPVNGPQDPVILKGPTGTGAPVVTRSAKSRAALSCSAGEWAPDFAGSFVYRAPSKLAHQWIRNGSPVPGATASTLNATAAGAYACMVTASNQAGAATQASAALSVSEAKLRLTVPRKVRAKAGKVVKLKLRIDNGGDLPANDARLCVKIGKRTKALKAPKCKPLAAIPAGPPVARTLRLKIGVNASGTYAVKLTVKGAEAQPVKTKIFVGRKK